MIQQNQFTGHPTKDPNEHLGRFLRVANTVKLNGVRLEVIKLHLFPFSLRDIAATWYDVAMNHYHMAQLIHGKSWWKHS